MKDEVSRMERTQKIISIFTEALLLIPGNHLIFTSFIVTDLIHLKTKIKVVKTQLLRKQVEDNCHRRYISGLQLPRSTS